MFVLFFFFFQAEDGIRDFHVTGVQTCALPISTGPSAASWPAPCGPRRPRSVDEPSTRTPGPRSSTPTGAWHRSPRPATRALRGDKAINKYIDEETTTRLRGRRTSRSGSWGATILVQERSAEAATCWSSAAA